MQHSLNNIEYDQLLESLSNIRHYFSQLRNKLEYRKFTTDSDKIEKWLKESKSYSVVDKLVNTFTELNKIEDVLHGD